MAPAFPTFCTLAPSHLLGLCAPSCCERWDEDPALARGTLPPYASRAARCASPRTPSHFTCTCFRALSQLVSVPILSIIFLQVPGAKKVLFSDVYAKPRTKLFFDREFTAKVGVGCACVCVRGGGRGGSMCGIQQPIFWVLGCAGFDLVGRRWGPCHAKPAENSAARVPSRAAASARLRSVGSLAVQAASQQRSSAALCSAVSWHGALLCATKHQTALPLPPPLAHPVQDKIYMGYMAAVHLGAMLAPFTFSWSNFAMLMGMVSRESKPRGAGSTRGRRGRRDQQEEAVDAVVPPPHGQWRGGARLRACCCYAF